VAWTNLFVRAKKRQCEVRKEFFGAIYKKYHNYRIVTRQYFPKGMNVREISDKILAIAVKKINHKLRKCLDNLTPHEVYYRALLGAFAT
jgi:hypothetical protein